MIRSSRSYYTGIALYIIITTAQALYAECPTLPVIVPRGQGVNAALQLVGITNHIALYDMEKFYGTFNVTPMYTRSFNEDHLAECLFGQSLTGCECPGITIAGSDVPNRPSAAWLADQFGLPTDFESHVTFEPRISNYMLNLYLYLGLDEWAPGLFFFVHGPVVNTRWNLNACERIEQKGTANYPPGYFAPNEAQRSLLYEDFLSYASGQKPIEFSDNVTLQELKYARICCGSQNDTALADIRFAFGWNFFQDEDYHFGLGLMGAAPTGTRIDGRILFEPIIGNGHHWEVGGMAWGHAIFWRSECEEKFLAGWLQANVTHLFKTKQHRFFDLKCKPSSRYMLAQRMDTPVDLLFANEMFDMTDDSTAPDNQFKAIYTPVANLTHQDVDVNVDVQADVVIMLSYTSCSFTWDLGYNFWARSCENITPNRTCKLRLSEEKWALKGNAYTYGFTSDNIDVLPAGSPVALSATQSNATIHNGTNVNTTIDGMPVNSDRNPGVDTRQWATAGNNDMASVLLLNQPGGDQTNTSNNPVLLTPEDIDLCSAPSKGLSNTVFTHISYAWLDNEDWTPYLGFGAEIEFSQDERDRSCQNDSCSINSCAISCNETSCTSPQLCKTCSDCISCSISQWGVWIKGGVSFN